MDILLSPPIAFLAYLLLALLIMGFGRLLAGPSEAKGMKQELYASGESAPEYWAAPGYRPFFLIALFFGVLHLGTLVLGTGSITLNILPTLAALLCILIAFLLG